MKKLLIILISILIWTGCTTPDIPPEPVLSIYIEPAYAEIGLGKSIELYCYDQLNRPVIAHWSKRCPAGALSVEIGESCIYTAPKTMPGVQEIYAGYEELKAMAHVNGIRRWCKWQK